MYLLAHNPAILIYPQACVLLAHHYYLSAEDQVVWLLSGRLLAEHSTTVLNWRENGSA